MGKRNKPIPIHSIACMGCGEQFEGKVALYCPACRSLIQSRTARRIGLNRMGNESWSEICKARRSHERA